MSERTYYDEHSGYADRLVRQSEAQMEKIFQIDEDELQDLLDSCLRTFAMKVLFKRAIEESDIQEFIAIVKPKILGQESR